MKRKLRKIVSHLPARLSEYFDWLLCDASENHIRITKTRKNNFRSFTQLKKHQRMLKFFVGGFLLATVSLLLGLIIGPNLFPKQIESELYVPNGKGDILLANISKNQATIIFKTLDGANDNKPLPTKAFVEIFEDRELTKFVLKTQQDDYAVTHIVPIDSLREGNIYYVRINVQDSSIPRHSEVVSAWGDENDPIKFFTVGDAISFCTLPPNASSIAIDGAAQNAVNLNAQSISMQTYEKGTVPINLSSASDYDDANVVDSGTFRVSGVMSESYLQPKNKVQTIVSWITNKPATTILIYGEGRSNEKKEVVISKDLQTKHAAVLTTLDAGKTYYFNVKSVDQNGFVVASEEYALRTPKPQSTISEKIGESFNSLLEQKKP